MNKNTLLKILDSISKKNMPPTLGYAIDKAIFSIIAEVAARNIYDWGWERYVSYIETWKLKIAKDDILDFEDDNFSKKIKKYLLPKE